MRILWRGLVVAILAGTACGGGALHGSPGVGGVGGLGGSGGGAGSRWTGTVDASINRNVDILFMIDDSTGMRLAQTNLLNNFPTLMTTLLSAPQGMPNLHLAIVSQDMGAGDGSIAGCDSTGGKNGIFQYTARGTCPSTNLQAGATYISNIGGVANYTGNIADVFTCIAALGSNGCGFEHQFAAVLRALGADGQAAPAENQGFLRPDAYLAIVMLTDEDDCSAAPGVPLFDTTANQNMASQLGPPTNFRCNEFGHACPTGVMGTSRSAPHPDRNAPNRDVNATVNYDGCTSDDTEGFLLGVKQTADALKALKTDPSMVALATISAPATPYQVHWKPPSSTDTSCNTTGQSCPWPEISHSCTATDGSFGDPGVRMSQLVAEFGGRGLALPICDTSFAPSVMRIGQLINSLLGPTCISGLIALDPATGEPDCNVTARSGTTNKTVPACADNGGAAPCWQLVQAASCSGQTLTVSADPALPASASATISYSCGKCTPGVPEPARGCP
jgi:hypothetical protein